MSVRDVVQAAAGALGGDKVYVEDVFSTYLYTGNGSTQTITNGIDLDGEGGLVWLKSRSNAYSNRLVDSARGVGYSLISNATDAQNTDGVMTSFNSNGFTTGSDSGVNQLDKTYASWTFRKAPKFFDVVTWTGNGVAGREIAHNLGSVPACIIAKCTSTGSTLWPVYHVGTDPTAPEDKFLRLNDVNEVDDYTYWNDTAPTDTHFTIGNHPDDINGSGKTYVAYLFAHDAGGFGDDGSENVISCGSYTGNGSSTGPDINLGFEPQFVICKCADVAYNWYMADVMRGMPVADSGTALIKPNTSEAEFNLGAGYTMFSPTATGFKVTSSDASVNQSGQTYIYIAIRRGPMKTPESGTEVFNTIVQSPQSSGAVRNVGFAADLIIGAFRNAAVDKLVNTRLTGFANTSGASQNTKGLFTNKTDSEANRYPLFYDVWNTTAKDGDYIFMSNGVNHFFRRAPGFFDVVAYTGNGTAGRTINHNLGVAPELMISKSRNASSAWTVLVNFGDTSYSELNLESTIDQSIRYYAANQYLSSAPSNSSYVINTTYNNNSGVTYVAYLFASCPGVSKVGSYTGTAADLNVDCGFSAGARFVLIKRTDSTGDWYVWDSARGIVAGNDPYLLLNSTAAEVTSTDYIDPLASGFTVTSSAPAALNASGGSYIFLAIA